MVIRYTRSCILLFWFYCIGGVTLALLDMFIDLGINWDSSLGLSLILLPFGIGTTY